MPLTHWTPACAGATELAVQERGYSAVMLSCCHAEDAQIHQLKQRYKGGRDAERETRNDKVHFRTIVVPERPLALVKRDGY